MFGGVEALLEGFCRRGELQSRVQPPAPEQKGGEKQERKKKREKKDFWGSGIAAIG